LVEHKKRAEKFAEKAGLLWQYLMGSLDSETMNRLLRDTPEIETWRLKPHKSLLLWQKIMKLAHQRLALNKTKHESNFFESKQGAGLHSATF
jgi:hypothetical protein